MNERPHIPDDRSLEILELEQPQRRRALAEAYAETVTDPRDQWLLLKTLDTLQTLPDLDHLEEVEPELRALIERHRDPYQAFIAKYRSGENRTDLVERQRNAERYAALRPAILPILAEIKERVSGYHEDTAPRAHEYYQNLSQLTGFVGMSNRNVVFRLPKSSDRLIVAKVASSALAPGCASEENQIWFAREFQSHLRALRRARGIPHTVQLDAWSASDGVIVMTEAPGRTLDLGPNEATDQISQTHLEDAVRTVIALAERGVAIDGSVSANFFFHPPQGIVFIDFDVSERRLLDPGVGITLDLATFVEQERSMRMKSPYDAEETTWERLTWVQTRVSLLEELPVSIALFRAGGYKPEVDPYLEYYGGAYGSKQPTDKNVRNGDFTKQLTRTEAEIAEILQDRHPEVWERLEGERLTQEQRHEAAMADYQSEWVRQFRFEAHGEFNQQKRDLLGQWERSEINEPTYRAALTELDAQLPQRLQAALQIAQEEWVIEQMENDPAYNAGSDVITKRIIQGELTEAEAQPLFDTLNDETSARLTADFQQRLTQKKQQGSDRRSSLQ